MDSYDELTSFSFLNAEHADQEEFIKLKDASSAHNYNDNLGSVFDAALTPVALLSPSSSNDVQEPSSPASSCPEQMPLCPDFCGGPRSWKLTHLSGLLIANNPNGFNDFSYFTDNIHIEVRTRSDISNPQVPERLYSSLKYEMRHSVQSSLLLDSTNVLMCKVEVVNPQDHHEEILKTNGQKLIKGIQEVTAMSKNASGSALECKMKIQFTDVSYHHEKKYFAFKVSFIDPLIHVSEPVLVLVSAPFQVFARRPTTRVKKESVKKTKQAKTPVLPQQPASCSTAPVLKRKEVPVATVSPTKKIKSVPIEERSSIVPKEEKISLKKSATLNDFLQCLDLLIAFKNSLTSEEQKIAHDVAQRRLFAVSSGQFSKLPNKKVAMPADQDCINSFFSDM